ENTGLVNISIPIHPIGPGDPLPSNNLGSWQMTDPTQWNALISSFAGVAFFVDVAGSTSQNEHFLIDNFCFTPAIGANVGMDIKTECGSGSNYIVNVTETGQGGVTFSWVLFQTDQPNQTSGGVQISGTQTGPNAIFSGLEAEDFYYVQLTVTDICGGSQIITQAVPYHAIESIFHFEDAAGNPQTTFCYGEDVFLDGAASFGENNYWIGISRRPYPNNGQGWQNWADVSWTNGQVPNNVNLSAVFADINYFFEPGWEYNLKLAVQNVPECVNWVETVHTFVVECCDDFFDPKFILLRKYNPVTEMYVLEAVEYELYSNVDVQHTWTILTSPNLDGGPYTLEAVLTGDEFSYEVPGELCYFVIHSVETDCGTWCYGESDCINAGESLEKEACDLCGPIDCSYLKEICLAPGNPKNQCLGSHPIIARLKWDAVAGALGYVVEITWNDDECCETELPELTIEYQASTTHLDLNDLLQPDWKCLRWRVRAICDK
ncbi:MAG: hypothetical protein KDC44_11455, partial [Phaeodactylibacter sp.]|nr:hypothetical protein [Phaeodactylibacter sp.]